MSKQIGIILDQELAEEIVQIRRTVRRAIGDAACYEQLAEEAAELAQAALKKARKLRGENRTPKSMTDIDRDLVEEYSDVINAAETIGLEADPELTLMKCRRWMERNPNPTDRIAPVGSMDQWNQWLDQFTYENWEWGDRFGEAGEHPRIGDVIDLDYEDPVSGSESHWMAEIVFDEEWHAPRVARYETDEAWAHRDDEDFEEQFPTDCFFQSLMDVFENYTWVTGVWRNGCGSSD